MIQRFDDEPWSTERQRREDRKKGGFLRVDVIRPHGTRRFDGSEHIGNWIEQMLIGASDEMAGFWGHRNEKEIVYGSVILEFNAFYENPWNEETQSYDFEWYAAHFMT